MSHLPRRNFLAASATLLGATTLPGTALLAPAVHTRSRTGSADVVTGQGDHQYKVDHQFVQLPKPYLWQTTHNVAVDSNNHVYVIHEGNPQRKAHPSIFVFDDKGKFVRAFGSQFQGGGHGIDIRKEGDEEFVYVAAYLGVKAFAKLTLRGDIIWYQKAPMESERYDEGEHVSTKTNWTRKGFLPTNFAFLDDGGFLLADGYGAHCIHRFNKEGKWQEVYAGTGPGKGTFNLCHGLTIDNRPGREPAILVTDRSHNTLQYLSMSGKYIETLSGFGLPANVEARGSIMMVPELKACVKLMNEKNEVVAKLGEGTQRLAEIKDLRKKPDQWTDGQFVHPHDACFDQNGNIIVAEWVAPGRVTKLTKIS